MKCLIVTLKAETDLAKLNGIVAGGRTQIDPVPLRDGRKAVLADLLDDCGPGQTYAAFSGWLGKLVAEEIIEDDVAKRGFDGVLLPIKKIETKEDGK